MRYSELKEILEARRLFKIVCGAGNEDPQEVRRLVKVYTLAGATAIDISANIDILKSTVRGVAEAEEIAPTLNREIRIKPLIMISVGLKGDPHIRKAKIITDSCTACGRCREICHQNAIAEEFKVRELRCIGCGDCADACIFNAIEFYDKRARPDEVLPVLLKNGADTVELHAATAEDEAFLNEWEAINLMVPDHFISVCLDRSQLSDRHLIQRIQSAYSVTGERLIIQADGAPMSGGKDDFNTTLQAIATADIVQKSGIPIKILASGGTNSKTGELARICGVKIHGVSIGTFARKIIKQQIGEKDFDNNLELIEQAALLAEDLINKNMEIEKE